MSAEDLRYVRAGGAHALRRPDKADMLCVKAPDEIGAGCVARRHEIGQHDVKRQGVQPAQEILLRSGPQHDLYVVATDDRLQKCDLKIARERGERTDSECVTSLARGLESGGQILGRAEDFLGVVKRDPPGLGQHEVSPASLEKVVPQGPFQGLDLGRDRRL